jgi:hypothetical protein
MMHGILNIKETESVCKANFPLEQATKAHRGSRGIAVLL